MKYLLTGVETNNKGAELMLYAILQQIRQRDNSATVYIDKERVRQGVEYIQSDVNIILLENKWDTIFKKFRIYSILAKIGLRNIFIFPKIPRIDYLIDGSGLHFTDQLSDKRQVCYWKHIFRYTKIYNSINIFLPQGFGPIEKYYTKTSVELLLKNADLVYARDYISFEYLQKNDFKVSCKVKTRTDFTSLVACNFPSRYELLRNKVCIIPNMQMVNKGVVSLHGYIDYLVYVSNLIIESGKEVYFLNHEGDADEELIYKCIALLGKKVTCVSGLNARETKGLISTAYFVITSRYHGLASALYSNIPCLSTSWSHKYACLYQDFDIHDCILSILDRKKDSELIKNFLDERYNVKFRAMLSEKLPWIIESTQDMWKEIWSFKK